MSDQWTAWKARMTRAEKQGPIQVLECWDKFQTFCEENGWPDWWIRMQLSANAAELDLRYGY